MSHFGTPCPHSSRFRQAGRFCRSPFCLPKITSFPVYKVCNNSADLVRLAQNPAVISVSEINYGSCPPCRMSPERQHCPLAKLRSLSFAPSPPTICFVLLTQNSHLAGPFPCPLRGWRCSLRGSLPSATRTPSARHRSVTCDTRILGDREH
jgi:hypothetical protein